MEYRWHPKGRDWYLIHSLPVWLCHKHQDACAPSEGLLECSDSQCSLTMGSPWSSVVTVLYKVLLPAPCVSKAMSRFSLYIYLWVPSPIYPSKFNMHMGSWGHTNSKYMFLPASCCMGTEEMRVVRGKGECRRQRTLVSAKNVSHHPGGIMVCPRQMSGHVSHISWET